MGNGKKIIKSKYYIFLKIMNEAKWLPLRNLPVVSEANIRYFFPHQKKEAYTLNTLPNFEISLTEIAELIEKMERGELTLEQSLGHFERGITLIKHCQKILGEAEQKVKVLIQNNHQEELLAYGEDDKALSKE